MITEIPRLILPKEMEKPDAFSQVERYMKIMGLDIQTTDKGRPWGGFYVISPNTHELFLDVFFPQLKGELTKSRLPISAKVLVAEPGALTSDQYHERRKEAWKIWSGPAEVHHIEDKTDRVLIQILDQHNEVRIESFKRHRLGAPINNWAVVAETWIHTDPNWPSDEEDIFRKNDLYGRVGK